MRHFRWFLILGVLFMVFGCNKEQAEATTTKTVNGETVVAKPAISTLEKSGYFINPDVDQLLKMNQQFRDVELAVPLDGFSESDLRFLRNMIKAADVVDHIFWKQVSEEGQYIMQELVDDVTNGELTEAKALVRRLVEINYGHFDRLDSHKPFIGRNEKPLGATFYPANIVKQEFEEWIVAHPKDKESFESPYTIIRSSGGLLDVPYSKYYRDDLAMAIRYLLSATKDTDSPSMSDFLIKRADAFKSNDYRPSDEAWVKVEGSKFEVVIGPYETYEDRLMGYKAAFEAFITVIDQPLSAELGQVRQYLADMEKQIPLDDQYRGYQRASGSPVLVVNVLYSTGDGRKGVQASAFNLPNDEYVRKNVGTKNVLIRNVQQAKFGLSLEPISKVVLVAEQQPLCTWNSYFWHNLLHELSHGIGPGIIKVPYTPSSGDDPLAATRNLPMVETTVGKALKETYGPMEELKADALGFWMVDYLIKVGLFQPSMSCETAVMSLAGFFRAVRFGADEAHGVNNLMYYNYLKAAGVYAYDPATVRFTVNFDNHLFHAAVTALAREVLTIEATGNYEAAKQFMAKYGKMPPEAHDVLANLGDIPVDIHPIYSTAEKLRQ